MGTIIGAGVGLAGSLLSSGKKKSADATAAQQNLTGYNYLTGNAANKNAQDAGIAASGAAAGTQGAEAQLLGTAPVTDQTKSGFNNYLNSTGYKFQRDQGTGAITGNAASRGLINSGGTAKKLLTYGQGLAGQSFNNYLNNLSGLNTQQQSTANTGVTAAEHVGAAGTQGGQGAGQATMAGGAAQASGIGGVVGGLQGIIGSPGVTNFLGSL
jgi:hypothetical protein